MSRKPLTPKKLTAQEIRDGLWAMIVMGMAMPFLMIGYVVGNIWKCLKGGFSEGVKIK